MAGKTRDGHFGVRWMAEADKKLITEAAKRNGMNVGQWLGEAARLAVAKERERSNPDPANLHLLPPGAAPERYQPAMQHGISELTQAITVIEWLAARRGGKYAGRVPARHVAFIRHAFEATTGLAPPAQPRLTGYDSQA